MHDLLERTLQSLMPSKEPSLSEMGLYSLEGGKRLRPLLTLAVVEAYGLPTEPAAIPACALEFVHAYSLIHDDLPCMDNDDMRRGRPSLHKAFPQSHAILTGDWLLTYAFEVIASAPHLSSEQRNALVTTLAVRAGAKGMIGGQLLDISGDTSLEMSQKKTGALITAALEFGAILSKAPLAPFQAIGEHLGLAYQVVDDLIDRDGLAKLYGHTEAEQLAHELHEKSLALMSELPVDASRLKEIATEMICRTV